MPAVPEWLDGEYVSPLVERVETIRREILRRAQESKWVMDEAQLTDQALIRRMVLKRCIYGVDKNPLTVELAKVSLWLHSFTVGAPLLFPGSPPPLAATPWSVCGLAMLQETWPAWVAMYSGSAIQGGGKCGGGHAPD